MQKEFPLVSVLMTAYNREKYIGEAIESVLASTYSNFELIVSDDSSTDRTVEIANEYAREDKRVKVYVNEKNLGDYPNRNKAASYAKGKYLKYVDSDDIIYPFGLDMMINRMEAFPQAAIALAKRGLKDKPFPLLLSPKESYELAYLKGLFVFGNAPTSAIINRKAFIKTGGFSGHNQYGDVEFWLKAALHYPILLIEGDVTWNRDHSASEKYKDDVATKAKMLFSIRKRALEDPAVPLDRTDIKSAKRKLDSDFRKQMIKSSIRNKVLRIVPFNKTTK
ncbi:MAG: glycosyltransferase family 2 protein [Ginsengibacter sp.]